MRRAFTLIEMLVTIAVLGILAAILLPALAKAKDRGRQGTCINDIRQLAIAFQMYHTDNKDEFPAPGSKTLYGPQPEDWIWWQQDRDIRQSSIVPHLSGFNPALFTCPVDYDARSLQQQGNLPDDPYRYSYSLTSYSLTSSNVNLGMSTIITQMREVYPFRASQIVNPSIKIMLVEEDRRTINDPRWVPTENLEAKKQKHNLITSRHGGKGEVAFADTHVEAVKPFFGEDPTNSVPIF